MSTAPTLTEMLTTMAARGERVELRWAQPRDPAMAGVWTCSWILVGKRHTGVSALGPTTAVRNALKRAGEFLLL